jgi:hypothetical protein
MAHPSQSNALLSALAIPSHIMGEPFVPANEVEADAEQLAYVEAMGLDPFAVGNDGAERAALRRALWAWGV